MWEISVPSTQFSCEPKIALKTKVHSLEDNQIPTHVKYSAHKNHPINESHHQHPSFASHPFSHSAPVLSSSDTQ